MTKVTEYTLLERYSKQDHFTVTFASKQEVEFSKRAEYYCRDLMDVVNDPKETVRFVSQTP